VRWAEARGRPMHRSVRSKAVACARRSDRPKHLRSMLAVRRHPVLLSPSTRERVPSEFKRRLAGRRL
jgi:hypothetical protein